jgi:hypothetical protein
MSIVTTYIIGPKQSWSFLTSFLRTNNLPVFSKSLGTLFTTVAVGMGLLRNSFISSDKPKEEEDEKKTLGGAISGFLFALGLTISGMTKKSKVHDFLCPMAIARGTFDPSLVAVLGSAIGVSWLGYLFIDGHGAPQKSPDKLTLKKPLLGADWSIPTSTVIDKQLITGSCIFGVGWAITGLCPGPALYHAAAGFSDAVLFWMPSYVVGSFVGEKAKAYFFDPPKSKTA